MSSRKRWKMATYSDADALRALQERFDTWPTKARGAGVDYLLVLARDALALAAKLEEELQAAERDKAAMDEHHRRTLAGEAALQARIVALEETCDLKTADLEQLRLANCALVAGNAELQAQLAAMGRLVEKATVLVEHDCPSSHVAANRYQLCDACWEKQLHLEDDLALTLSALRAGGSDAG